MGEVLSVYVEGTGAREHCLRTILGRTSRIVSTPEECDLVVVGPEVPLVNGFADTWRAKGKLVFGPGANGARLEGSKAYLKAFLERANVPTARYAAFTDAEEEGAIAFLKTMAPPYVVKTSGLAAGKGVMVTESLDEAIDDIRCKLDGSRFGDAGKAIVIEEGLRGPEASLFVVCDGKDFVVMPPAQDAKRVRENDEGPNTGGMGAYSPLPASYNGAIDEAIDRIIQPTCTLLQREGVDYRGALYAGLMLTDDGPKLIEYNVRFGDPDSQVSLIRYSGDLAALLYSAASGRLCEPHGGLVATHGSNAAVNVVLAASGYPGTPRKGDVITGISDAERVDGVHVFQAGVAVRDDGTLVTAGGRVLNVMATGDSLRDARECAYAAVRKIRFDGMHYRGDIATAAAALEEQK